jgi:hypothetical protein
MMLGGGEKSEVCVKKPRIKVMKNNCAVQGCCLKTTKMAEMSQLSNVALHFYVNYLLTVCI